jgi:hypothetical protein
MFHSNPIIQTIESQMKIQRYNDSASAKIAMAPLWAEILDNIITVLNNTTSSDHVKFALFSGHDSTIASLMASLGPRVWTDTDFPFYASMMVIEVGASSNMPQWAGPVFVSDSKLCVILNRFTRSSLIEPMRRDTTRAMPSG